MAEPQFTKISPALCCRFALLSLCRYSVEIYIFGYKKNNKIGRRQKAVALKNNVSRSKIGTGRVRDDGVHLGEELFHCAVPVLSFFDVRSVAPRDLGVNRKLSTLHNFVSVFNA